ncbi:MAG: S8 family peptidase [Ignavibacteriae bacterium]|nr:S8 family peptidase [Ignavibacteriota bacterium]
MKFFLYLLFTAYFFLIHIDNVCSLNTNIILQPDSKIGRISEVYSNTLIIRFKKTVDSYEKANDLISGTGIRLVRPLLEKSQCIKNNKNSILSEKPEKIEKIQKAEEPLLRTYIIHYDSDLVPELYARQLLKSNHNIEIAEPYCLDVIQSVPDDPYVTNQDMLFTIHAIEAWDNGFSGDSSIVIGISDNGVFQGHEDLRNSIAPNWGEIPDNNIDDDGNGYIDDFKGYNFSYVEDNEKPDYTFTGNDEHGTNVAGICGATVNNTKGIAGVAKKCRIFPIKIATNSDPEHLPYGYESILYAAARKLKVLNCSWGKVKVFSEVDQSIIDYAIANDVAIVAAGGNGYGSIQAYYPAGYRGVLGVGEVDQSDEVTSATSLGSHIGIMAPGKGNYYTKNDNGYDNSFGGTSWASPVVAAAVALIRSKYPELSAVQSLEFVRQCTDDISSLNPTYSAILPGRLNLLRALDIAPFSIPSIKPLSVDLYSNDGVWTEKASTGDTLRLKINGFNYLGSATNLRFVLSVAKDPINSISVLEPEVNISEWTGNTAKYIEYFKFKIEQEYFNQVFFRVDIYADNNYHDFFLIPFTPTSEVTTFANKPIKYSVGDRGTFGFGGPSYNLKGVGFIYKDYGNQLYTNAGLMAVENNTHAVSSIFGSNYDDNDFYTVKPFKSPERYLGIVKDSLSGANKIGLEITQSYHFISDTLPAAKIIIDVKNISGKILNDVSVGYLLDWDIGPDASQNLVRLFPEGIPETFASIAATAELASYKNKYPVFAAACYSPNSTFVPQAAGLSDISSSFPKPLQIQSLTSGTNLQFDNLGDISMVIGMKFPGEMQPGETKSFNVCIAADDNEQSLALTLQNAMLGTVGVDDNYNNEAINLYPQPAGDFVNIEINNVFNKVNLKIVDNLGKELINSVNQESISGRLIIPLNVSTLTPGLYHLVIQKDLKTVSKPMMILR